MGSAISGILSGDYGQGNINAANQAQQTAASGAMNTLTNLWGQQQQMAQPYLGAGTTALSSLASGDFMKNWQQDPGYQFRMDQGLKGIQGSAAARGLNQSGATLKALNDYAQNTASQEYGNVYNREAGRLTGLAALGSNAMGTMQNSAGNYGNSMSNIITGAGNASAASQMAHAQGQQNQQNGLLSLGGTLGGAALGNTAMFSDRRVKKDLSRIGKEDIKEFKDSIKPYTFKYTDEKYGKGEYAGVMAQDLEKSRLGRMVVEEKDGVKTINLQKLASLGLAMMAE